MSKKLKIKTNHDAAWEALIAYESYHYGDKAKELKKQYGDAVVINTPAARKALHPSYDDMLNKFWETLEDPFSDVHEPSGENGISIFQYCLAKGITEISRDIISECYDKLTRKPAEYWQQCWT